MTASGAWLRSLALLCDGDRRFEGVYDLLNAPAPKKRIKGWLSIYPNGNTGSVRPTRAKCDELAASNRIACIEIDVEEGHGSS